MIIIMIMHCSDCEMGHVGQHFVQLWKFAKGMGQESAELDLLKEVL